MTPNFINIALCDNDFGSELEKSARIIADTFWQGDILCSEARIKSVVVDLVLALNNLSSAYRGFSDTPGHVRDYLNKSLTVSFQRTKPEEDHDGGSVCIDCKQNFVWRY